MIRVLFVCTGNICRSPTAEGVFRHLARQAGLEEAFFIASAGTDAYHAGEPPDRRAVKIALRNGISLDRQKARALTPEDFENFDYIFAMDGGHYYELQQRMPKGGCKARLEMFLAAASGLGRTEVPDPWYGGDKDFEDVYDLVHKGTSALFDKLRKDHGV